MEGIYQARGTIQRYKDKSFRVWLKLEEEGFSHEKKWWSKYRGNSATVRTCVRGGALLQKGGIQKIFSVLRANGPINTGNQDSNDSSSETVRNPRGKLRT